MLSDNAIAEVASAANDTQMAEAEAVLPRLQDDEVLRFANLLMADHTASEEELSDVLSALALTSQDSTISDDLRDDSDAALATLEETPDTRVDDVYVDLQVTEHQTLLALLETTLLPQVDRPEIRQFLVAMAATERAHLAEAERIRGTSTSR